MPDRDRAPDGSKQFAACMLAAMFMLQGFLPLPAAAAADPKGANAQHIEQRDIGDDIPFSSWVNPQVQPWAVLLCIHGLSLHGASYDAFGKRMADLGVPTYAIDVRGFGSWQNTSQANRIDFKAAMKDIHSALESLRAAHPDLPIVMLGESMGGALALQAGADNQDLLDGLICCVPAFKRSGQKLTNAKVAVGLLTAPNKQLHAGPAVVHRATKNEALIEAWMEQDDMARMHLSSKELLAFALFTSHNGAAAQRIKDCPVLFVQGAQDKLIKPQGTVALFNRLPTARKTLYMVNSEHLIFEHNQFNDQVIEHVASWMRTNAVPSFAAREKAEDAKTPPADLTKAEGHLRIAQGYLMLNDPHSAEEHLLQAVALARGSHIAQQAEHLLCTLPAKDVAPDVTAISPADLKFISHQEALASGRPSVVVFFADWIVGCHQVQEALKSDFAKYGRQVNFVRVDADAPENQPIIKRYGIKPIPSILFITPDNKVAAYMFGYPGKAAIEAKIRALVAGADRK